MTPVMSPRERAVLKVVIVCLLLLLLLVEERDKVTGGLSMSALSPAALAEVAPTLVQVPQEHQVKDMPEETQLPGITGLEAEVLAVLALTLLPPLLAEMVALEFLQALQAHLLLVAVAVAEVLDIPELEAQQLLVAEMERQTVTGLLELLTLAAVVVDQEVFQLARQVAETVALESSFFATLVPNGALEVQ